MNEETGRSIPTGSDYEGGLSHEDGILSESLNAVISQTLIKRIAGGRVAAHEIMIGTPAIRNLIREDKIAQMYSAIQTGGSVGMQTLDACLKRLVVTGVISAQDARAVAKDPTTI